MTDIDLSKAVATEASKQVENLKRQINNDKELQISLLKDMISDSKQSNRLLKKVVFFMMGVIFIMLFGLLWQSYYNQTIIQNITNENSQKMYEFLKDYDVSSTVEMLTDNESLNNGNISISK